MSNGKAVSSRGQVASESPRLRLAENYTTYYFSDCLAQPWVAFVMRRSEEDSASARHRAASAPPVEVIAQLERLPMSERRFVTYEELDNGSIVRIMLNRPEARNAQNRGMLVELNDAFLEAEADDRVRVVIFGGAGKMFSAGHDMGSGVAQAEW